MEMILELGLHIAAAIFAIISFSLAKKYYLSGDNKELARRMNDVPKEKHSISF